MHSSVYRKVLVAMTCALVLGAVGSASASAASSWWVAGSQLGSSEPLASSTTKVKQFVLAINTGGKETLIKCQTVGLKSADIASPSGGSIEHLVLEKCEVSGGSAPFSSCRLVSTTIESKALKLEAGLGSKSPEDYLVVKPAAGEVEELPGVLAEIPFEGKNCPFDGKKPVKLTGNARLVLPKGREEAVEQPFQFFSEELLHFGAFVASLEGEYKLKLSSGKGWSYH